MAPLFKRRACYALQRQEKREEVTHGGDNFL